MRRLICLFYETINDSGKSELTSLMKIKIGNDLYNDKSPFRD